jgi:hypothetical protein
MTRGKASFTVARLSSRRVCRKERVIERGGEGGAAAVLDRGMGTGEWIELRFPCPHSLVLFITKREMRQVVE